MGGGGTYQLTNEMKIIIKTVSKTSTVILLLATVVPPFNVSLARSLFTWRKMHIYSWYGGSKGDHVCSFIPFGVFNGVSVTVVLCLNGLSSTLHINR